MFSSGEPSAPTLGFDQIRAAIRAWNRVPTASFRFAEGPPITGTGGQVADGISTISFRDPRGQIADPAGCSGILATTWISWNGSGQTTVNGRTFGRLTEFDLVTANGWSGCGFYENFSNFTEGMSKDGKAKAATYKNAYFEMRLELKDAKPLSVRIKNLLTSVRLHVPRPASARGRRHTRRAAPPAAPT